MNTAILQRCVDELRKEPFSKDYVIGMLETLIELSGSTVINKPKEQYVTEKVKELLSEEDDVPPHLRPGPIARSIS